MKYREAVLYESSSTGGCYEYSKYLFRYYSESGIFQRVSLVLPRGSGTPGASDILFNDRRTGSSIFRRLYFLFRNLVNPFILFFFLLFRKRSFVLLNDFEQLTAYLWVPFFYLLKSRHAFAVFLHDPDREAYFSSRKLSISTIGWIYRWSDLVLIHEPAPEKDYYKPKHKIIEVSHGIYEPTIPDRNFLGSLLKEKGESRYISILGNIRKDKNYEWAIRAIGSLDGYKLLIAGSRANRSMDIDALKELAEEQGVRERITWRNSWLTEEELSAAISASDIIWLCYDSSYASQSGILNLIAPYKKNIITTVGGHSLFRAVARFKLGETVEDQDTKSLIEAVRTLTPEGNIANWEGFLSEASWEAQVKKVCDALKKF